MKRKKEYEQNASEERKNFMQAMELKRKENAKPSDLEEVKYFVTLRNTLEWLHVPDFHLEMSGIQKNVWELKYEVLGQEPTAAQ